LAASGLAAVGLASIGLPATRPGAGITTGRRWSEGRTADGGLAAAGLVMPGLAAAGLVTPGFGAAGLALAGLEAGGLAPAFVLAAGFALAAGLALAAGFALAAAGLAGFSAVRRAERGEGFRLERRRSATSGSMPLRLDLTWMPIFSSVAMSSSAGTPVSFAS
jgi:hypothetical protein